MNEDKITERIAPIVGQYNAGFIKHSEFEAYIAGMRLAADIARRATVNAERRVTDITASSAIGRAILKLERQQQDQPAEPSPTLTVGPMMDKRHAENARLTTEVIDTVEMLATAIARADAAEAGLRECRDALRGLFGMIEDGSFVKAEGFAGWRLGLLQKISAALAQPAERTK